MDDVLVAKEWKNEVGGGSKLCLYIWKVKTSTNIASFCQATEVTNLNNSFLLQLRPYTNPVDN